jgi:hypothetical protein
MFNCVSELFFLLNRINSVFLFFFPLIICQTELRLYHQILQTRVESIKLYFGVLE